MDMVSIALGAALFGSGWVLGRVAKLRANRGPAPVRPICECGHHYGTHDDGHACQVEIGRHEYDKQGYSRGTQYRSCACLRYVGPVPLDQFWSPPIANSE